MWENGIRFSKLETQISMITPIKMPNLPKIKMCFPLQEKLYSKIHLMPKEPGL